MFLYFIPPLKKSIHAPRGSDSGCHKIHVFCLKISIHAPPGSDVAVADPWCPGTNFNPRSTRERRVSAIACSLLKIFQSTLHAGATDETGKVINDNSNFNPRSTRERPNREAYATGSGDFNPRSTRERPFPQINSDNPNAISIHAPRGSDRP